MKRRKNARLILAAFLGAAVYTILFPLPAGKEHFLAPAWTLDLSRTPPAPGSRSGEERAPLWFRVGDRFGYVDLEAVLHHRGRMLYDVALSEAGFINYARIPENLVFRDPDGGFVFGVPSFGYPLLESSGARLYTINTDLGGIQAWSAEADRIWQAEFFSPLTSVSLRGEECLLGLVEGRIMFFGSGGELLYEAADTESRLPVVLATALRADAGQLAWISGIDPQRLTIVNRKGGDFASHFSLDLESDYRREVFLRYFEEGQFLAFEGPGGLRLLDLSRRRIYPVSLPDAIRTLALASEQGMLAVGTGSGSRTALRVFFPLDRQLYVEELPSSELFIRIVDDHLLLAFDDHLMRLDLLEG